MKWNASIIACMQLSELLQQEIEYRLGCFTGTDRDISFDLGYVPAWHWTCWFIFYLVWRCSTCRYEGIPTRWLLVLDFESLESSLDLLNVCVLANEVSEEFSSIRLYVKWNASIFACSEWSFTIRLCELLTSLLLNFYVLLPVWTLSTCR